MVTNYGLVIHFRDKNVGPVIQHPKLIENITTRHVHVGVRTVRISTTMENLQKPTRSKICCILVHDKMHACSS